MSEFLVVLDFEDARGEETVLNFIASDQPDFEAMQEVQQAFEKAFGMSPRIQSQNVVSLGEELVG